MADIPDELREALSDRLAGEPGERLRAAVGRLVDAYRSGTVPSGPILAGPAEVAAYAAYRMPATFAAVRAALPRGLAPSSLLDLGGGTGAAAWAAVSAYPSLRSVTVLDQVSGALRLGAQLASAASAPALRSAAWSPVRLPAFEASPADLVTVSYVLGELGPAAQRELLERAAGAARAALVIVEPGTPAGYARILAARERLVELGHALLAPCPHPRACPLGPGDWCHFGARVNRSALHRRIKDADLPYEDEKFSYLVTAPPGAPFTASGGAAGASGGAAGGPDPAGGAEPGAVPDAWARVIRRPAQRKGLVSLRLCNPDGTSADRIVTKRTPDLYRRARDTSWGDAFPAPPTTTGVGVAGQTDVLGI